MATTLYRCKTPTDRLCPCGKVARRLRRAGLDYEQVRARVLRRHRPEIYELTGQRWLPVLVHGDEVVHDSRRILQYIDHLTSEVAEESRRGSTEGPRGVPTAAGGRGAG
jgi:glutathione S-transferase